jgi:hypothetical protein
MRIPKVWTQALAVIAIASWRLMTPSVAEAAVVNLCGGIVCVSQCSEADWECAECPCWVCYGQGSFPCSAIHRAVYCCALE